MSYKFTLLLKLIWLSISLKHSFFLINSSFLLIIVSPILCVLWTLSYSLTLFHILNSRTFKVTYTYSCSFKYLVSFSYSCLRVSSTYFTFYTHLDSLTYTFIFLCTLLLFTYILIYHTISNHKGHYHTIDCSLMEGTSYHCINIPNGRSIMLFIFYVFITVTHFLY